MERAAKFRERLKRKNKATGFAKCHVCKDGRLNVSMASNGHIHMRCTTPGCIIYME